MSTPRDARMGFDLSTQRILITGASRGLGAGLAAALARHGASIVGIGRDATTLAEVRQAIIRSGGRFDPVAADLADEQDFDVLVDRIWEDGAITAVVHAAGIQQRKPAVDFTTEEWRRVVRLQLEVPFFLSASLARHQMRVGLRASHVFIGSLTSWIGVPHIAAYAASKSGILGVTRTLAVEWAKSGIRVNAICPGYYLTELTRDLLSDPTNRQRIVSRIPMGRLGHAEDLAGAAIYLISDMSSYVTGQVINVDGGWLAA